jgi:integrase
VPASPDAFRYLGRYLATDGLPAPARPVWRTRRGDPRPLTYWAMRRVLQRANEKLGTNYTLHDARHTAATRMAADERLTLAEIQAILRHAHLDTTGHYLTVRVEDLHDKLQEHYTKPRPQRSYPAGYDPADIEAVFGG